MLVGAVVFEVLPWHRRLDRFASGAINITQAALRLQEDLAAAVSYVSQVLEYQLRWPFSRRKPD